MTKLKNVNGTIPVASRGEIPPALPKATVEL